ncbi:MAG TPA: hypothetical protein VHU84_01100 [Lacipirellulaceae bacterium]|jgi:hypothetical protein|nr:hypothetical protein [Lacipirellulaceae bacterium]
MLAAFAADREESRSAVSSQRCAVRKESNGWWLVDPTGKLFFSLGICEFNQGTDKQNYDPNRPSYAGWQHHDSPEAWAAANVLRLKNWGFTTLGAWSDYKLANQAPHPKLWMTPELTMLRSGGPWFDMWDDKVLHRIEELAEESIAPLRGNPQVIGYYSDNELGWWNATMWKMALDQPATSGQRQRLIGVVREDYSNDWNLLVNDFEPENAANWDELDRRGMLWLRPGGKGIRTMRRFLGIVAERYYHVMRDTIHRLDPGALYLGDRYQSFYYPEVAKAAGKHVDVVSTNLNASWNDGTFLHAYLDTLHNLTGKPVLISEFYMAAAENGTGNKNERGVFPAVATQVERGHALTNTLCSVATLSYVVGADWFQYYDEPPQGRVDGEDYNFGLVDIRDRPYAEVTQAFATMNAAMLKSAPSKPPANAKAGVPPAPAEPLGQFQAMTALKNWDRERGFVPSSTENPVGDLYVCWTPEALHIATYVIDIAEPNYYKSGEIPEADRAKWKVQVNTENPITMRIGAGKDPVIDNPTIRIASLSGTYHNVRCITAIAVPAKELGKQQFEAGDHIALKSSFDTLGRAEHMEWNGEFELAK